MHAFNSGLRQTLQLGQKNTQQDQFYLARNCSVHYLSTLNDGKRNITPTRFQQGAIKAALVR